MMTEYIIRDCYMKDMEIEFVAERLGIDIEFVQTFYDKFDKEMLSKNIWFKKGFKEEVVNG